MLSECDYRTENWKLRRGGVKEIDFLAPVSGAAVLTECLLNSLKNIRDIDKSIIVFPQVQCRAFRIECSLFHTADNENIAETYIEASARLLAEAGAYFDRPYGRLAELVYSDEPTSTETLRSLKNIFDPDNVLNPGKLCF